MDIAGFALLTIVVGIGWGCGCIWVVLLLSGLLWAVGLIDAEWTRINIGASLLMVAPFCVLAWRAKQRTESRFSLLLGRNVLN